jgi:alcohol dehydrogenase
MRAHEELLLTIHSALITGEQALEEISSLMGRDSGRPYLISDAHASITELLNEVLRKAGITPVGEHRCTEASLDIPAITETARDVFAAKASCIIAAGSKTAIDMARAVSICCPETFELRSGSLESSPSLPVYLIPSLTGALWSAAGFISMLNTDRMTDVLITSKALLPAGVILEAHSAGLEGAQGTAAAAMEAVSCAVESVAGLGRNPVSDGCALTALRLICSSVYDAVGPHEDTAARMRLLEGIYFAGRACSNSMPGLSYVISRTLYRLCGIPQNLAASILLPYSIEYNLHRTEAYLEKLQPFLGTELSPADSIREINRKLNGLTRNRHALRFHDVTDENRKPLMRPDHIPHAARMALENWMGLYNPEQADFEDIRRIIQAAYWGYPLDKELVIKGHQR